FPGGCDCCSRRENSIRIEPLKIAFDPFMLHDLFDAVDGIAMAGCGEPRAFRAPPALHELVRVVHRAGEVRGRAPRDATRDRAVVEHHDLTARARQVIRNGHPGDAGADDDHVSDEIASEWRICGKVDRCGPKRLIARALSAEGCCHALNTRAISESPGITASS